MKLLILDQVFPIGHKSLNAKFIHLLSKRHKLVVLNHKEFYNPELFNNVIFIDTTFITFPWKNSFFNILSSFLNSILIGSKSIFVKHDKTIMLTFDTIGYALLSFFVHKPVYLFHHNNTDHLRNKSLYLFFKIYKDSVFHIVFAEYIKEALLKYNIDNNKVYVLPHPLTEDFLQVDDEKLSTGDHRYYVGLGYATDENIIQSIIDFENKTKLLKKNDIYVVLRSAIRTYESNNIRVIKGHLNKSEYENYFNLADAILLLYPKTYENRFSGVILDAFRHSKKVIGTSIPVVKYFENLYPESCISFDSISDFFKCILNINNTFSDKDFNLFVENHMDSKIEKKLFKILNG